MSRIEKDSKREIIEDFRIDINEAKDEVSPPKEIIVDFRDDVQEKRSRKVYKVPIDLLRYRKNNGRISSDIMSYEKYYETLEEDTQEGQEKLREFLAKKDPEMTEVLKKQIEHSGQRQPAIITCDGFLINGNRRKVVLESLYQESNRDPKYRFMRVVILPGSEEPGGGPSLLEIEQIENRYQLQREGKSEYTGFDRALSMRRKMEIRMSLEEQLRDDPEFSTLNQKEFKREVEKAKKEYLKPLECIDRYLRYFEREGLYDTVSSGPGDPEGRWQAFIDYSNFYNGKLKKEKERMKLGIPEEEVSTIENVAFKIIRKRSLPEVGKVHMVMRHLHKLVKSNDAKKELFRIEEEVPTKLPKEGRFDEDGSPYKPRILDEIWGGMHQSIFVNQIKKANRIIEYQEEREKPLNLLLDALKKLHHRDMKTENIDYSEINEAMEICRTIQNRAGELESEFDHYRMKKEN